MAMHSAALQKAVFTALSNDSSLSALSAEVYDDVIEGASLPYVVVGEETATNIGTKTVDALEHTLTIHAWSQYRGRKEVKDIMAAIYDALHNVSLSLETDSTLVNIRQEFAQTIVENDGITRHGIMRFRAVVFDND